jgi:multidrug efflux pump subunit AcrB
VLVEVQMPEGTSIETTSAATAKVEAWLRKQPEAKIVTSYIGQGAPRFFLAMSPELPDPSFAKIVVLTRTRRRATRSSTRVRSSPAGHGPRARIRATQIVFGPLALPGRVPRDGPRPRQGPRDRRAGARRDARQQAMRQVNTDWGERVPTSTSCSTRTACAPSGLSSHDASEQLQFLLTGAPVTQVREDIRSVEVVAPHQPAAIRPGWIRRG